MDQLMQILYEDNHLLVVVKPPNLPVQADASGDADLLTLCKRYIKEKYNKPGEAYLGLVHRLDRPAGGVMVFARTSKAAARLSAQFRGRGAHKQYAVLTAANVSDGPAISLRPVRLRDHLLREGSSSRPVPAGTPGAQEAALAYERVARAGELTLLDVTLLSGRHHQIRVQLASRGMPLWGDQRYDPAARPGQQLALWAYALRIEHPTLHIPMTFTALPEGPAWQPFARQLAAMALGLRVAYEDEQVLCAVKPAGLETSPSGEDAQTSAGSPDPAAGTLLTRVCTLCGAPVYAVHRLDVNTTGLVLFAKTPAARDALTTAMERRQVDKTYRCLVRGPLTPPEAVLTAWLVKDEKAARVAVHDAPVPGAKEIVTAYCALGPAGEDGAQPAEVQLLTGRTHQIRAHMAHTGHPLLGDDKYGERDWNRARKVSLPQLCAVRLAFRLPPESPLCYLNDTVIEIEPPF